MLFDNDNTLRNRIIYSDTLNETELLRTLAKHGINTLGLRVMNSYDLSLYILSRLGRCEKRRYLSNKEQDYVYFVVSKAKAFNDASNIRSSINTFRDTGKGNSSKELDQYLDSKFVEKRIAVVDSFDGYNKYKKDNNCYDQYDLLYDLNSKPEKLDVEVYYFSDLSYSELALSVFSKFFDLKNISFSSLPFSNEEKHVFACFGKNNEIASVINTINSKKLKLDQCLVVLVDSNDSMELMSAFEKYNIPFTSSLGIPFIQTNVGKLVATLKKMDDLDWGIDAFTHLFNEPFFSKDKYTAMLSLDCDIENMLRFVGWLRPSFGNERIIVEEPLYQNESKNYLDICMSVQMLCNQININNSVFEFVKNNVVEDDYLFESLQLLEKYDSYCKKYNVPFACVIDGLLNSSILSHISKSGAIHICSYEQAFSSIRENVFVVGLDSKFPGNPKENYLIFDEEFKAMGAYKCTSTEIVKQKETLMKLLINSSKYCYLSYPFCNIIDTKFSNPSSVLMNIDATRFSYEDNLLLDNNTAIKNNNKGQISDPNNPHDEYEYKYVDLISKTYSPSKISEYFDPEQKLKFILEAFFDVKEYDEDDPYSVISPIEKGKLLHKVAVGFEKKCISLEEFVEKGLFEFEKFLKTKPPITKEAGDNEKESFKKALVNFYNNDLGNKCIYSEKNMKVQLIEDIKFIGTFDRLEMDAFGNYILVDYKTSSSKPKHVEDKVETCLQGLIYAEMIEKQLGIKVQRCEFRYPFIPTSVQIICTQENMDKMHELISVFRDSILDGDFNVTLALKSQKHRYIDKYKHLISLLKELTY